MNWKAQGVVRNEQKVDGVVGGDCHRFSCGDDGGLERGSDPRIMAAGDQGLNCEK